AGIEALPFTVAALGQGHAPVLVQPVGAEGQLGVGGAVLDQALGGAPDDLVAGNAAGIAQFGDARAGLGEAGVQVQPAVLRQVPLVLAGQLDAVGAGV